MVNAVAPEGQRWICRLQKKEKKGIDKGMEATVRSVTKLGAFSSYPTYLVKLITEPDLQVTWNILARSQWSYNWFKEPPTFMRSQKCMEGLERAGERLRDLRSGSTLCVHIWKIWLEVYLSSVYLLGAGKDLWCTFICFFGGIQS